ncbi:MAG TPA: hypothetical protein VMM55_07680 [Thermohalobaculum sp.]|nr:hypothetical protein [Thermohalobaculum sp.]
MLQNPQEGAELLSLAEAAEKHLREQGHEVKIEPNAEMTAFEVLRPEGSDEPGMVVRVQSLRDESWEMVRPNGETITGVGGRATFLAMMDRLIDPSVGRPQHRRR